MVPDNNFPKPRRGILSWLPPSFATFIYTVLLKPAPLRALAQSIIRRLIPQELIVEGVTLVMNQRDAIVCGSLTLGCYETSNLRFFTSLLRPGMCVFDVGANIGLYTALAASRIGAEGRVVSVEPESTNCDFIRRTVARNGFQTVRVYQGAAGSECGEIKLFLCESNKADHRVYDRTGKRPSVPVKVTTLDALFYENSATPVDVMKIDTQGFEPAVVAGMGRLLDSSPNIKILMEYWPWGIRQMGASPDALLQTFTERGFVIQEIDADSGQLVPVPDANVLTMLQKERQHVNLFMERK